jgi:predicted dehydrogenase
MYTLLFSNPGHFHAALTLRERHRLVREEIYVYAEQGPDLDAFLEIVRSFNERSERPTAWNPRVYTGADHMERLMAERRGEVVVIAGKNDSKMATVARLHEAGFHVLADKPWLVGVEGIEALNRATAGGTLVMDIMTGRFEITHILPRCLTGEPDIFGEFLSEPDGGAAVTMDSVHHLYKTVNEVPLVRPDWYFDVRVQGDGIVDIPSHLVDKVLWMMAEGSCDYDRDVPVGNGRHPRRIHENHQSPRLPGFSRRGRRGGCPALRVQRRVFLPL